MKNTADELILVIKIFHRRNFRRRNILRPEHLFPVLSYAEKAQNLPFFSKSNFVFETRLCRSYLSIVCYVLSNLCCARFGRALFKIYSLINNAILFPHFYFVRQSFKGKKYLAYLYSSKKFTPDCNMSTLKMQHQI